MLVNGFMMSFAEILCLKLALCALVQDMDHCHNESVVLGTE